MVKAKAQAPVRWLGVGIAAVLIALTALVCNAVAEPISVTPDSGYVTQTINFGDDRGKKKIPFYFTAAPTGNAKLTTVPNPSMRKMRTSDGTLFDGKATPHAVLGKDGRTITVTVDVDPAKAKAGDYAGDLLLRGDEVTDARAQLTVKLHPLPWPGGKEAYAWLLALSLLLVGAFIGWAAQWLAGPGTRLRNLVNRFEIVSALTRPLTPLPVAGLATAFDPNETFRTHAGSDAVKLFIWGLAAGLSGVTINQLSGRLTPSTAAP